MDALQEGNRPRLVHGMVAESAAMKAMLRELLLVSTESKPVVLQGETGAGKELAARALHAMGHRRDGPFEAINCGALSPTLVENELFGHVRGAYTGAEKSSPGAFLRARGGTLLLDEAEEMTMEFQVKLLRVLSTDQVLPIGADRPEAVNVRILIATNQPLAKLRDSGRLRADLYFRLSTYIVDVPPLRERPEDVLPLAGHFLSARISAKGRGPAGFESRAEEALRRYRWPGNVRELENAVDYAHLHAAGRPIVCEGCLPPPLREVVDGSAEKTLAAQVAEFERALVRRALLEHGRSYEAAASALHVSVSTMKRKLRPDVGHAATNNNLRLVEERAIPVAVPVNRRSNPNTSSQARTDKPPPAGATTV